MLEENEVDSQGDMAGISIKDLEIILAKHGLPTSKSGTALNALSLNGFLDKARGVFNAKISKGQSVSFQYILVSEIIEICITQPLNMVCT